MDPHVSGEFLFCFGLEGACYFEDELFMLAAVLGMFTSASKTCIADIILRNNFLIFFFITVTVKIGSLNALPTYWHCCL